VSPGVFSGSNWRRFITPLKLLVTASLVLFLLSRITLGDALGMLAEARLLPLFGAVLLFGVSVVAGAWQWGRFLAAMGLRIPARKVQELYWVGLFFNNFMPGNVGGDVVKVLDLSREQQDPVASATATLADRITGLSGLAFLALLAAIRLWDRVPLRPLGEPIIWGSSIFLVCGLLFLNDGLLRLARRLVERLGLMPRSGFRAHILDQLRLLRQQRSLLLRLFAFSLLVQGLRVGVHYLLGLSLLGASCPSLLDFFLVIPPLAFALTLPVTIGGIGLREGLAMPLFLPLGVSGEGAVAVEFLAYLLMLALSLLGGLLFLLRRSRGGLVDER
jgi:glycosyltransferase 2 family protein